MFDADAGVYVFEVVLSFHSYETIESGVAFLVQADDAEEAEEKVLEHLDSLDLQQSIRIEEFSEPYTIEEYQRQVEESGGRSFPVLDELSEEELKDFFGR